MRVKTLEMDRDACPICKNNLKALLSTRVESKCQSEHKRWVEEVGRALEMCQPAPDH